MLKVFPRARKCLLAIVVWMFFYGVLGCLESSFILSSESRLPKWLKIPSGLSRSDISVTLDYYGTYGNNMKLILKDMAGRSLAGVDGKIICHSPASSYPGYELVAASGIDEVIEHKQKGPVFYINDDPSVRQELLACKW